MKPNLNIKAARKVFVPLILETISPKELASTVI